MKRPVAETYLKLSKALGEPSELSLRKQFCLQFLKWGFTTKKEDKEKFEEKRVSFCNNVFCRLFSNELWKTKVFAILAAALAGLNP